MQRLVEQTIFAGAWWVRNDTGEIDFSPYYIGEPQIVVFNQIGNVINEWYHRHISMTLRIGKELVGEGGQLPQITIPFY